MTSPEMAWDRMITCLLASVVVWMAPSCASTTKTEFCHWEALEARCSHDEVIVIDEARYGRMRAGDCVSKEFGHVGCYADVTNYLDYECSGKRECKLPVTNFVNKNIRPCPKDVTSYMEATYHCQKVERPPSGDQCLGSYDVDLKSGSGYITSLSTTGSSSACTWSLSAKPGQHFNISMLDFNVFESSKRKDLRAFCPRYGILWDGPVDARLEVAICAKANRFEHVHLSKSNTMKIQLFTQSSARFLLHYQVIGCPDLSDVSNLHVTRDATKTTVTCPNNKGRSWTLHCRGNKWIGSYGNCTPEVLTTDNENSLWQALFGDGWSSPKGLAVVVALGVLLGIVIGALLLCVMIFILKKRNHRSPVTDKSFTTINHQRTRQVDAESHDLDQDYFREKLLHVEGDPDLVTTGKCLCPEDNSTMTMTMTNNTATGTHTLPTDPQQQQQQQPQHQGTMRSVYVYPRGTTHLYEKPGYNDMIT